MSESTAIPEAPLEGIPERSRGGRGVLAAVTAAAVVVGAVVAFAGRSDHTSLPVLALQSTSRSAAADGVAVAPGVMQPYRLVDYVHSGPWTALPAHAVVHELRGATVDEAVVRRTAHAFGIDGTLQHDANGWTVTGAQQIVQIDTTGVVPMVSLYAGAGRGSSPGSTGSGTGTVGGGSTGSTGTGGTSTVIPPDLPTPATSQPSSGGGGTVTPQTIPAASSTPAPTSTAPADLPSPAAAEARVRRILSDAGILDGEWRAEVADNGTVSVGAACPPNASCVAPNLLPSSATSRSVTFHRVVDGHDLNGADWYVEIGNHGAVLGASGPLATLVALGDYPLRSIDDAFADVRAGRNTVPGTPGEVRPLAAGGASSTPVSDAPVPGSSSTTPTIPPTRAVVDSVAIALVVADGTADGRNGRFVIPVYRFHATDASGVGSTVDASALSAQLVSTPTSTPTPVPQPAPAPKPAP